MATVRDYFSQNFPQALTVDVTLATAGGPTERLLPARTHMDFDAMAIYASVFLPPLNEDELIGTCRALFQNPGILLEVHGNVALPKMDRHHAGTGITVETSNPMRFSVTNPDGASLSNDQLVFTRRLYLYTEQDIPEAWCGAILEEARKSRVVVSVRGPQYVARIEEVTKNRAFISHDSRDKDEIARPLAIELGRRLCRVWLDEFSLSVGDSLRASIETGLKTYPYCILILTPNFLSKGGWPKREYDAAFTRELMEDRKVLLPIWHNVTQQDVYNYSPMLADRLGISWALGREEVGRRLYNELMGADA